MVVAPAALTLTAPKGKPPTESIDEIRDSGLLTQLKRGTIVYPDGCQSWKTVARKNRKQRLVVKSVVHMRSEWTRKVRVREERKLQEPNKLIVVGNISQNFAPVKWRTALAQQSMLDSGIESINGSIATTCPSET